MKLPWDKDVVKLNKRGQKSITINFQRKPTCFNRGMNLVNNFVNTFCSLD